MAGHSSPDSARMLELASKIERQDVQFLSDGDWLKDSDSEIICAALRAQPQRSLGIEVAKLMDKHGLGPAKPQFWLDLEAIAEPQAAEVTDADVIIVAGRLRALNALKEDYGQVQHEKVRKALESIRTPPQAAEVTDAQLADWVQHLDWDTGLTTADEIKQLRALLQHIGFCAKPQSGESDQIGHIKFLAGRIRNAHTLLEHDEDHKAMVLLAETWLEHNAKFASLSRPQQG
jgi:hypothetical protein